MNFSIYINSVSFEIRGPLAQLAEHRPFKAVVGGSNPARLNNKKFKNSPQGEFFILKLYILTHFAILIDFYGFLGYIYTMNLKTVITTDTIDLHLKGSTKKEIINELLDILVRTGKITDREAALAAVMEREDKMSTGMKHGIAIPHGKSASIPDLVACIGISEKPVEFDSLDHEPCRIFIMTLSPVEKTGPHLQFLAEVSLLFKSSEKRKEILNAKTPEEIQKILAE